MILYDFLSPFVRPSFSNIKIRDTSIFVFYTKKDLSFSLSLHFMNSNERPSSNVIIKFSSMLIGCISDNIINSTNSQNNKLQYNQGILSCVCRFRSRNERAHAHRKKFHEEEEQQQQHETVCIPPASRFLSVKWKWTKPVSIAATCNEIKQMRWQWDIMMVRERERKRKMKVEVKMEVMEKSVKIC